MELLTEVLFSNTIESFCYNPTGNQLAISSTCNGIRIYDIKTGIISTNIVIYDEKRIYWWYKALKNNIDISAFQLSWNLINILTFSTNCGKEIVLICLETDSKFILKNIYPSSPFDWNHDGNKLLYITFDKYSGQNLNILDYRTQTSINILNTYKKVIISVKFSPNEQNIALVSWNGYIEIYNVIKKEWNRIVTLADYNLKGPRSLHWNSTGTIITTPLKKCIRGWDIKTGYQKYTIPTFEVIKKSLIEAVCISFCYDNKKLLYISDNGSIVIWDVCNSSIIETIITNIAVEKIIWSPTGDTITLVDIIGKKLQIWKTNILNRYIKDEIHNSEYAMKPYNVVYSQNIDVSKYKKLL